MPLVHPLVAAFGLICAVKEEPGTNESVMALEPLPFCPVRKYFPTSRYVRELDRKLKPAPLVISTRCTQKACVFPSFQERPVQGASRRRGGGVRHFAVHARTQDHSGSTAGVTLTCRKLSFTPELPRLA
jgi:hypothetical protein